MNKKPILEMTNISKSFPGVKALQNVNLEMYAGEILALMGENGAGKSTLIKVLSGAYKSDEGEITLEGQRIRHSSPTDALNAGISVIYQELNNVDQLSIAENIFLGSLPLKKGTNTVDYKKLKEDSEILLQKVGLKYDAFTEVTTLSIAEKQLVEIAKAISKEIKVLVMDEPTAALNNQEIELMFRLIRQLSSEGVAILYVSHRFDEIFTISDKVMIMRDGQYIGTRDTNTADEHELVTMMVGREITDMYPRKDFQPSGECGFEVRGLTTAQVSDISFKANKGEIVGLFGLMGCGRTAIVEAIFGAVPKKEGRVFINQEEVTIKHPWEAKKHRIAYIPSDRKRDGLMLIHSVKKNASISVLNQFVKNKLLDLKKETETVLQWVDKLKVKAPSISTAINLLSGGNQQKVVLAKWLMTNPDVLIVNEPTRGIDVGAKAEIYNLLNNLAKDGKTIIMVSSDLPEIMAMSNRIVVIHEGKVNGVLEVKDFSQDALLKKAIGLS